MKYARVLLANCPQQTTELFIVYYAGKYQPRTEVESPAEPQVQPSSTLQSLAGFLPLGLINVGTSSSTKDQVPETTSLPENKTTDSAPDYAIPKPRAAFSAFVDHPQQFIIFLEALTSQPNLREEDKVDLFTTLFEMYLDTAKRQKDTTDRTEWETKAKKLIEGKDVRSTYLHFFITSIPDSTLRYPFRHQTSSCYLIYLASEKAQLLSVNKKVYDQTSSGRTPLPRIRKVP